MKRCRISFFGIKTVAIRFTKIKFPCLKIKVFNSALSNVLSFNQKMAKVGAKKNVDQWIHGKKYNFANITGKY